jgi:hypothetical protein
MKHRCIDVVQSVCRVKFSPPSRRHRNRSMAQRRIISIRPSAANSQRRTSLFERPGRPTSPGERMATASQMFREEQPRTFAHIKKDRLQAARRRGSVSRCVFCAPAAPAGTGTGRAEAEAVGRAGAGAADISGDSDSARPLPRINVGPGSLASDDNDRTEDAAARHRPSPRSPSSFPNTIHRRPHKCLRSAASSSSSATARVERCAHSPCSVVVRARC